MTLSKSSSISSKSSQSGEKLLDIFNNDLEINLDNEIIYKSIPCTVDTHDVPIEKFTPPPLTKRVNIELEHLLHDKNIINKNIINNNSL